MDSNQALCEYLQKQEVLKTPDIVAAFSEVDRADFVRPEDETQAYSDHPLTIDYGQTISQPSTVAFMLEILQPSQGCKILDVGSGSGWTTALLAYITGETGQVIGMELVPELVEFGQENLAGYEFDWAQIKQAEEGTLGVPEEAPFDRILVSAAADELPSELVEQLGVGGRMVISVRQSILQVDKNAEGEIETREFPGFAFVPLIT